MPSYSSEEQAKAASEIQHLEKSGCYLEDGQRYQCMLVRFAEDYGRLRAFTDGKNNSKNHVLIRMQK